jgi:hypothetical protein
MAAHRAAMLSNNAAGKQLMKIPFYTYLNLTLIMKKL